MLVCEPKINTDNLNADNIASLPEEAQACLGTVLNLLEDTPENVPNAIMKKSVLTILSSFYRAKGDYAGAIELEGKLKKVTGTRP